VTNDKKVILERFGTGFSYIQKVTEGKYDPVLHFHECFEIYCFVCGSGSFVVEGKIYDISRPSILLLNDTEIHKPIILENGKYERLIVLVNPTYLKCAFPLHFEQVTSMFNHRRNGRGNQILLKKNELSRYMELFDGLVKAEAAFDTGRLERDVRYLDLVSFVYELYSKNGVKDSGMELNSYVKQAIKFINLNFNMSISLDDLAGELFVNKNYLCTLFKKQLGCTIGAYVASKRMAHASLLLRKGESVRNAALEAGFNDYTNFIRSFKRYYGYTPSKLKKTSMFKR